MSPIQQKCNGVRRGVLVLNKIEAPIPSQEAFLDSMLACSETLSWVMMGLQAHIHSIPLFFWELATELGLFISGKNTAANKLLPVLHSFSWHHWRVLSKCKTTVKVLPLYLISHKSCEVNVIIHLHHKTKQNPKSRRKISLEFNPGLFGRVNIWGIFFFLERRQC